METESLELAIAALNLTLNQTVSFLVGAFCAVCFALAMGREL